MEVVAECDSREAVWRIAKKLSDRPIWEEHYEKMTLVKCVPPPEVFRHPQTCFLVTDGSSIKDVTKPVKQPESRVRMKVRESEPPKTPRSASWPEQERTTDWRLRIKKLIGKL